LFVTTHLGQIVAITYRVFLASSHKPKHYTEYGALHADFFVPISLHNKKAMQKTGFWPITLHKSSCSLHNKTSQAHLPLPPFFLGITFFTLLANCFFLGVIFLAGSISGSSSGNSVLWEINS
jgi:hypothetical protein